jgi:hypothetical protein
MYLKKLTNRLNKLEPTQSQTLKYNNKSENYYFCFFFLLLKYLLKVKNDHVNTMNF